MPALPTRSPMARVRSDIDTFTIPEGCRRRVYRPGHKLGAGLSVMSTARIRSADLSTNMDMLFNRLDRAQDAQLRPKFLEHVMTRLRTELQRGDLTGKGMDIILNFFEVSPGEVVPRHIHPGEEIV